MIHYIRLETYITIFSVLTQNIDIISGSEILTKELFYSARRNSSIFVKSFYSMWQLSRLCKCEKTKVGVAYCDYTSAHLLLNISTLQHTHTWSRLERLFGSWLSPWYWPRSLSPAAILRNFFKSTTYSALGWENRRFQNCVKLLNNKVGYYRLFEF